MPFNTGGIPLALMGVPGGVATLDFAGHVPASQLPTMPGVSRFAAEFDQLANMYCPNAPELRQWDVGIFPPSGLSIWPNFQPVLTTTASFDGGALSVSNNSARAAKVTGSLVTDPSTDEWGISFDAILPSPTTGIIAALGLSVGDNTPYGGPHVAIVSNYDLSVDAQTHIFLEIYSGAAYTRANLAGLPVGRHRYAIYKDAANVRVTVDGILVLTEADLSNIPAGTCGGMAYANTNLTLFLSRFATHTAL